MSGENKKKCYLCGQEYEPGYPYVGNSAICPTCWAKVNAGTKVEKVNIAEGVELTRYIPADLLKAARQRFEIKKEGLSPELTKWAEQHEQRVNQEIKTLGLDKAGALPTKEKLAKLTSILLRAMYDYTAELRAENERLKKRRPPAKTVLSGRYLDGLFDNKEKALARIEGIPALKTDLVRREKIEGMIRGGDVGFGLDVDEMRAMQGVFNILTEEHDPEHPDKPPAETITINSWNDFYRAAGVLETLKDGKLIMDKWDKIRLYNALHRLRDDKKFAMLYHVVMGYDKDGEPIIAAAEGSGALVNFYVLYRDLTSGQLQEIKDKLKDSHPEKYEPYPHQIVIVPNPVVAGQYNSYWRLGDSSLYRDIRKVLGPGEGKKGPRVSKYDMLFIYWLQRHAPGRVKIQTNREALARELGMDEYLTPEKRWRKIDKVLLRAYGIAYKLGYLTKPAGHMVRAKRGGSKEVFYRNPAKIIQARQPTLPGIKVEH